MATDNKQILMAHVTLQMVKETKNMVRYEVFPGDEEANRRATTPNLYLQKSVLAAAFGKFPKTIQLTIEEKPTPEVQ